MFTVGVLCMSHGALIQGLILDHLGLFPLRLVGGCCFLLFFTTLLLVPDYPMVYWISVAVLGTGQYTPLMTGFPITSIFPNQQSTITTLYSGIFDASGSFPVMINKLYAGGSGIGFESIILFFVAVSGCMCLRTFLLLPAKMLPPVTQRPEDYSIADDSPIQMILGKKNTKQKAKTENDEIEMESLREQDKTVEEKKTNIIARLFNISFILNTVWFCIIAAFITWKFAVLDGWLNWFFDNNPQMVADGREKFNTLMLLSILASPIVGLFVDNVFKDDKIKSITIMIIIVTTLAVCLSGLSVIQGTLSYRKND